MLQRMWQGMGAYIFSNVVLFFREIPRRIVRSYFFLPLSLSFFFLFFKESSYCFPLWLYQFTFPPTWQEGFLFSACLSTLIICCLLDDSHSEKCGCISFGFDLHFPVINVVERFFIYFLPVCMSVFVKIPTHILCIPTFFYCNYSSCGDNIIYEITILCIWN